jgi:hypothetical protein
MPYGDDSLPMAVFTAQEQDLRPLVEESAELLGLDDRQVAAMQSFLHDAWFFGIRTGHQIMVETKMGRKGDPTDVIAEMQGELRDLLERLGEALDTTVSATIAAWDYLGQAWIAGSRFWEVEIAARLIEVQAGGFEEALRHLEE